VITTILSAVDLHQQSTVTVEQVGSWLQFAGIAIAVVGGIWVLAKISKTLKAIVEALAIIGMAVVAVVWTVKALVFVVKWLLIAGKHLVLRPWRAWIVAALVYVAVSAVGGMAVTIGAIMAALGSMVWAHEWPESFEKYAGRFLRSAWLRWTHYHWKMPKWLAACGLGGVPLVAMTAGGGQQQSGSVKPVKITGVRSGGTFDHVTIRVPDGSELKDVAAIAGKIASSARKERAAIRPIIGKPGYAVIDLQRRDLLKDVVVHPGVTATAQQLLDMDLTVEGLQSIWVGLDEYGRDHLVDMTGVSELVIAKTGGGKGSVFWARALSLAPYIAQGLVQVWAIDPKKIELAFGRGAFHAYADTTESGIAMLKRLIEEKDRRTTSIQGKARKMAISHTEPLILMEVDEFMVFSLFAVGKDETAAKQAIGELVTQCRAVNIRLCLYSQDGTKDAIPARDLFPNRTALATTSEAQTTMALGDDALERGAFPHLIPQSSRGVAYTIPEVGRAIRWRAGWVSDEQIKAFEAVIMQAFALRYGSNVVPLLGRAVHEQAS
jgi:S-DNA-T family DNA segregation ATPase FtsK/SpoIIIE